MRLSYLVCLSLSRDFLIRREAQGGWCFTHGLREYRTVRFSARNSFFFFCLRPIRLQEVNVLSYYCCTLLLVTVSTSFVFKPESPAVYEHLRFSLPPRCFSLTRSVGCWFFFFLLSLNTARSFITATLMGATNVEQIDQNVATLDVVLPDECLAEIITVSFDSQGKTVPYNSQSVSAITPTLLIVCVDMPFYLNWFISYKTFPASCRGRMIQGWGGGGGSQNKAQ